jgi:hypothetical protein
MLNNCFLKFYNKKNLIYSEKCIGEEKILSKGIECTYTIPENNFSFYFDKVVVYNFDRETYWMSFNVLKHIEKNSGPIQIKFFRDNNSLSYILED